MVDSLDELQFLSSCEVFLSTEVEHVTQVQEKELDERNIKRIRRLEIVRQAGSTAAQRPAQVSN